MISKQRPVLAWTGRASRWLEHRAQRWLTAAIFLLMAFCAGAFYQMAVGFGS